MREQVRTPVAKHPVAVAWYEWLAPDEGKACMGDSILHGPSYGHYLQNRLWRAFMAGTRAALTGGAAANEEEGR